MSLAESDRSNSPSISIEKGIAWIEIQFEPEEQSMPQTSNCPACEQPVQASQSTEEFPYLNLNTIVRFNNVPAYSCGSCGLVTTASQVGEKLEGMLFSIVEKLEHDEFHTNISIEALEQLLAKTPYSKNALHL